MFVVTKIDVVYFMKNESKISFIVVYSSRRIFLSKKLLNKNEPSDFFPFCSCSKFISSRKIFFILPLLKIPVIFCSLMYSWNSCFHKIVYHEFFKILYIKLSNQTEFMFVNKMFQTFPLFNENNSSTQVCWLSNGFRSVLIRCCAIDQYAVLMYWLNIRFVYLEQCRRVKKYVSWQIIKKDLAALFKVLSMCVLIFIFSSVTWPNYLWDLLLESFFLLNFCVADLSLFMVSFFNKNQFSTVFVSEFTSCWFVVLIVLYNAQSSANSAILLCLQTFGKSFTSSKNSKEPTSVHCGSP